MGEHKILSVGRHKDSLFNW